MAAPTRLVNSLLRVIRKRPAKASRPDVSAAEIARHYDWNVNLLFNRKKKYNAEVPLATGRSVVTNKRSTLIR